MVIWNENTAIDLIMLGQSVFKRSVTDHQVLETLPLGHATSNGRVGINDLDQEESYLFTPAVLLKYHSA